MSLLLRVIKLRLLIQQLTNTEFNKFTSKLVKSHGREIILSSLFQHFLPSNTNHNNFKQIDDILNIISSIINVRKRSKKKTKTNKIDQIPSELQNVISSFLEQRDYSSFCNVNRTIYVACNDPNTLQHINLLNVPNYAPVHLENYASLIRLDINFNQFDQFVFPNQHLVPTKLQHLVLHGQYLQDIQTEKFLNKNLINFSNLEALTVRDFNDEIDKETMYKILSKFSMIKHLVFFNNNIAETVDTEEMKKLFPELISLSILYLYGEFSHQLLKVFGPQLETLGFYSLFDTFHNVYDITFDKLENLALIQPQQIILDGFINTSPNLKNISITLCHDNEYTKQNSEITNFLKDLIHKKACLEYIEFSINAEEMAAITDSVESALYKSISVNKEEMTIYLAIDYKENNIDLEEVMMRLCRITNALKVSNINKFLFTAAICNVSMEKKNMVDILRQYILPTESINVSVEEEIIKICNFDCVGDGWRQLVIYDID